MTDYAEEQAGEMEALEAIYCGELEVICDSAPRVFTLPVKSPDYEDSGGSEGLYALLKFTHTPKYPDELPILEIEEKSDNLEEEEFLERLTKEMEENLGMVMVFSAVTTAIEWLCERAEFLKNAKEEAAAAKKEKEDEEERKKLEGTKVTIESFLKWKASFEEELLELKGKEKVKNITGKMTGKELFLNNDSLKDSDIQFLEAAGETVQVDESLFEDLDELDLDDDDEDDPDWEAQSD